MDFELSSDQKLLLETVSSFVKKESPVSRARKLIDDPLGYSKDVWRQMGELGWLGVVFPDEVDGFGGTMADAALLLEKFGSTLVPEPYVPTMLAGLAILRGGDAAQHKRWLVPMVAGETVLSLATVEADGRFDSQPRTVKATSAEGGYRLTGEKRWVISGNGAQAYVVSAASDKGPLLLVVDQQCDGLEVTPVATMDGRRAAMLNFTDALIEADRVLGEPGDATVALLEELVDVGAAACCAEAVGVMQAMLDMTVEYLKTREQFGKSIGTFQALQHRAVDMFVETQLARSAASLATLTVVEEEDPAKRAEAVSAAKAQVAVAGRYVSQQAIQLHGGIGISHEHDIGLYFKRMHVLNTLFGDEAFHVERYGKSPGFVAGIE